jgi:kumamolisin
MHADEQPAGALPQFTRWLAGSDRPRPASHRHLGALHPDEAVAFTLVLRRRPGSPPFPRIPFENRPCIANEEYVSLYGADPAELEAAAAFVRAEGMTVLEAHAGRRTLAVLASAAQVRAVLGVALQRYEDSSEDIGGDTGATELPQPVVGAGEDAGVPKPRSHRGFDGAVRLPAELSASVTAVVGLDDRFLGVPRGAATGTQAAASGPTVAAAVQKLKVPNTGAYGEVIGVFAAQPPGLPGTAPCYLPSDVTHLYFAGQPAGYRTRPMSVLDINLTVGATTYKNDPSQVTKIDDLANADSATLELTQEISTSATVAQGARVNVYFTEASEQGYLAFMNRVLLPEREKQPTVLSFSLAIDAEYEAGTAIGSSSLAYLVDELFHQIAALGISIFIAVRERGAGKWRLLAAPNLAPSVMAPRLPYSLRRLMPASISVATALSPAALRIAARTGGLGDSAMIAPDAPGLPGIGGEATYSGFFVNGISYSYAGASCVASFYAGTTALLRSAFGAGLGFLNSMLFQLRATGTLNNHSNQDRDARAESGGTADESDQESGIQAGAQFFAGEDRVLKHSIKRWDMLPMRNAAISAASSL